MQTITKLKFPEIKTALPGPKAQEYIEKDHRLVSPSYTRAYPLVMQKGYGALIEDVDGNIFLDFNAGVGVSALGHGHPAIADAIYKQANEFNHICSADYYYPHLTELVEKLHEVVPGDFSWRAHFGNSGAEAIEGALKTAVYATGRHKFIAFRGAFHGRTFGALSLTASKYVQRKGFGPQLLDVTHVPYANPLRCPLALRDGESVGKRVVRYIEENIFTTTVPPEDCAAIVVEAVQGEGGYVVPPSDFLPELRNRCDKHGILLVLDEVQAGMGRTGKMWAFEHFNIIPDIICMAKALGGGLPLAVTFAKAHLMQWHVGAHASTFGGNPVAIAAALKTIEILQDGLIDNAATIGAYMMEKLKEIKSRHSAIVEVRGLGLMIGVEFSLNPETLEPCGQLRDKIIYECFERGLVLQGAGESSIRFSPPLIVDREQVDFALNTFEEAVKKHTS
ncbi:MAG: acetyl ornithine aminotransferase family protein [Acidobacteriota bacterium]